MGRTCCVFGCHNRSHDHKGNKLENEAGFYSFPAWKRHQGKIISDLTKRRRMAWIAAVKRKSITFNNISRSMVVCSRHFHDGKPAYEMQDSHPDWVPSVHLGCSQTEERGGVERFQRRLKRLEAKATQATQEVTENTPPTPELNTPTLLEPSTTDELPAPSTSAPSDSNVMSDEECVFCKKRCIEIDCLRKENRELKEELSKFRMDEKFLQKDEAKVKYYTGLSCFNVVQGVLTQLLPCLSSHCKLSPFQMLLVTLMHLRLNLPFQHLSYLFDVDRRTISNTFRDTIAVMYTHLKPLVHWPERHCLRATMPHQFLETFGNRVAVIIDCFEIGVEKASNVKAKAQTFSHYKHKHTLKYLIGITPQGAISFISKGWGGRISDKKLTEDCGILNKLLPRDIVLADRGFDIADSVAMVGAELKTPAFTRGRSQLDGVDVEETRELAHLRVHVERVIGLVRNKYTILTSTVPLNLIVRCEGEDLVPLDKIVHICCALTNMCPGIVISFD